MPLEQADLDKIAELLKPANPAQPPIVLPHLPNFNVQQPKSASDWMNLFFTILAALGAVLSVYHQQTTPDPAKPVTPVVVPVTPTPVDPAAAELKAALDKISSRLDALEKKK